MIGRNTFLLNKVFKLHFRKIFNSIFYIQLLSIRLCRFALSIEGEGAVQLNCNRIVKQHTSMLQRLWAAA